MKRERVLQAIQHQQPDRVPRGELLIAPAIIEKLCPDTELSLFERKIKALEKLTMDFVTVNPSPSEVSKLADGRYLDVWGREVVPTCGHWVTVRPPISSLDTASQYRFPDLDSFSFGEIRAWVRETDFFVFALLDGVFQSLSSLMDFNEFMIASVNRQSELKRLAEAYGDFLYNLACRCLAAGAHGLIIGDDMAASAGPLVSPRVLEQVFFPVYERILGELKKRGTPVIFHCDGNIQSLLPYLSPLGFAGVHSLEPAAGMDLAAVKKQYGAELCLMGNIDPVFLEQDDLNLVKKTVKETLQSGMAGGGFILSTASGSLTGDMVLEAVLTMYLTEC